MHQTVVTFAVIALVLPPALAMIRSHRRSRAAKSRRVSKKEPAEASPEIDFTMQHGPIPSAADTLRALATSCEELGIDYPDVSFKQLRDT